MDSCRDGSLVYYKGFKSLGGKEGWDLSFEKILN